MRREVEHGLQVAVARYLDLCLDPARTWWTAIDHGAGKMSKRSAGMMKARGVKRGLPDIIIMTVDCGAFGCPCPLGIELKSEKGRLTPEQRQLADAWERLSEHTLPHWVIEVARSVEEVQSILTDYHVPLRHKMIMFGGSV